MSHVARRPSAARLVRGILAVGSPPVAGSLRWAEGWVVLVSESNGKHQLFGRKRRPNVPEGRREKRYVVKVTASEDVQLRARAEVREVTVARLLFESAMDSNVVTAAERKEAVAMLFKLQREMSTVANNVNQIARYANTERRFVAEAEDVLVEYRALSRQIESALAAVNRT
ncbi:MobC family plasmid mobilization relaxosome protein [Rathayibacter sp. SD072]|uniref:MobC family plasmid mobilization relaxosome protein n=1 Tax=Rathayibacter sp. SD072 TaxID=2781731 RepID=UPI0035A8C237